MIGIIWNLLSFILALGILIFIHEYGHFWVARRNGIKVLKFSVGFGRTLHSWHDKQGTEYSIGLIPLGGYVRMLDGRIDDVSPVDEQYTFNNKKVTQRIAVVSAGPLANFIFAAFALFIMLLIGVPAVKPVVGEISQDSIAQKAGLTTGDLILSVEDNNVVDWQSANFAFLQQVGNDSFSVTVERNEQAIDLILSSEQWNIDEGRVLSGLGITPFSPKALLTLAHVVDGSPAEKAGLQVNDELIELNNISLTSWPQTVEIISGLADQNVEAKVLRNGELITFNLVPENKPTKDGFSRGYLGVSPNFENWPKGYVFDMQYGILPALQKSFEKTWTLISLSVQMIGKLIVGDIGLNNLSGPISIAQGAGISAQSGFVYFLSFLALISVNLGVVNLLPLPVLDGGHLMYFFIELIRGKPVSERVQEIGFRVGAFVLMMIMGIAIINDFARL